MAKRKIEYEDYKDVFDCKLRKNISLSVVANDVGTCPLSKKTVTWISHSPETSVPLSIPMFNTTDARNLSVQEVADYVDKVLKSCNENYTTDEQISIPQLFINQVVN